MARRRQFTRLGDHHLGVDVEFKPNDDTEYALFQAIGTAEDVDILKASLRLPLYQIKQSAHEVLVRHGVPRELLDDAAAVYSHVRNSHGADTEPGFAANLVVMLDAFDVPVDPRFLHGALRMFMALKLHTEMKREFRDGPALARERSLALSRKNGGVEAGKVKRQRTRPRNAAMFKDFEASGYKTARGYAYSKRALRWSLSPERIREILGEMQSTSATA